MAFPPQNRPPFPGFANGQVQMPQFQNQNAKVTLPPGMGGQGVPPAGAPVVNAQGPTPTGQMANPVSLVGQNLQKQPTPSGQPPMSVPAQQNVTASQKQPTQGPSRQQCMDDLVSATNVYNKAMSALFVSMVKEYQGLIHREVQPLKEKIEKLEKEVADLKAQIEEAKGAPSPVPAQQQNPINPTGSVQQPQQPPQNQPNPQNQFGQPQMNQMNQFPQNQGNPINPPQVGAQVNPQVGGPFGQQGARQQFPMGQQGGFNPQMPGQFGQPGANQQFPIQQKPPGYPNPGMPTFPGQQSFPQPGQQKLPGMQ